MDQNPLQSWFRQPGIHVKLPSGGKYNAPGAIDFSAGGEVAIFPMTAADEIVITNPDSLLNGSALERVVKSCCPAINDLKAVLVPDADVIILAAKLLSYGDELGLRAQCPHCSQQNDFNLSIRAVLEQTKMLPPQVSVRLNDQLVAYLRPFTLTMNNEINMVQFEETKRIQNLSEDMPQEERSRIVSDAFQRMSALNLQLLSHCIVKIATPHADVTDHSQIREFLDNTSRDVVNAIRDGLQTFTEYGLPKETEVICNSCEKAFTVPIVYDPASFFA
jgi:hypothetical protein